MLQKLIAQNPSKSEYHRILGQILSDEGHPNLAINTLIDALKWDTQNNYALIMMGNIYARDLDDVEGAMIFYDQVVKNNPKDYIALNNIGANLLRQNKAAEAIKYFEKAHQNNPNYANIYAGLGMANAQLGKYSKAFEYLIHGIKIHGKTDDLHKHLLGNAYGISQKVMTSNLGELSEGRFGAKRTIAGNYKRRKYSNGCKNRICRKLQSHKRCCKIQSQFTRLCTFGFTRIYAFTIGFGGKGKQRKSVIHQQQSTF